VDLRSVVAAITGERVTSLAPVGGGDVGDSARAELESGARVFVKHYPQSPPEAVRREAEGLAWLAEARAVPVAHAQGFDEAARVLVLDWIEPGRPTREGDAELGRGLAALHRFGADTFGALPDNFIGSLPQSNRAHVTWPAFFGAERIERQVRIAVDAGHFDKSDAARAARLVERLEDRLGPPEPPARLHGDLWGGNRLCDASGRSWLIDPAAYAGHREVDLAMMRLFGGFSSDVFDAYEEAWPLTPGAGERVELHQLYPVLVHVNLFGGSYVASARRILARYA
jgi:fructosamine-3-kinase